MLYRENLLVTYFKYRSVFIQAIFLKARFGQLELTLMYTVMAAGPSQDHGTQLSASHVCRLSPGAEITETRRSAESQ